MTASLLFSTATFRHATVEKVSFIILTQLDLTLTILATSLGFTELNPWMSSLLSTPLQLFLVKLLVPVLIAWLVPGRLLLPAIAFLFFVLGWNIKELLLTLF